jgi:hypothetical protein
MENLEQRFSNLIWNQRVTSNILCMQFYSRVKCRKNRNEELEREFWAYIFESGLAACVKYFLKYICSFRVK